MQALAWSNDRIFEWIKNQGIRSGIAIVLVEIVVDWAKFTFVTKFNRLEGQIFSTFKTVLCADLVFFRVRPDINPKNSGDTNHMFQFLDSTHAVTKKIGFVSLPLCCTVMHCMVQSIKGTQNSLHYLAIKLLFIWIFCFLGKILLSIVLFGHSAKRITAKSNKVD